MTTVRHDPPSPHGSIVAGQAMTPPATPQPQLLPCPFCGRDGQPIGIHNDLAHCPNKQCVLYSRKMYHAEWNTRADSAALQSLREERDAAIAFAAGDGDTAALVERAYLRGLGEQGIADHQLMRDELAKARAEAGGMREALEWCERAMGWATAPNSCIDRYIEVHEMAKQALAGGGGGG